MKKNLLTSLILGCTVWSYAATTIWTGAIDTNFGTAGNWDSGAPNFEDTGVFSGPLTANQPDLMGGSRTGNGLRFESAGWTISDSVGGASIRVDGGDPIDPTSTNLYSAGAGVNRIVPSIGSSGGDPMYISVASGNTLQLSGTFGAAKLKIFSGGGTLVFDGPTGNANNGTYWDIADDGSILLANTGVGIGQSTTYSTGVFGGTGSLIGYQYGTTTFDGAAVLSPGGNGAFGAEIGSLTLASNSATIRHNTILDAGATVAIQLGTGAGESDKLIHNSYGGGKLTLNSGVILSLSGGSIAGGDYVIVANAATDMSNIVGTFSTVLYNGIDVTSNPDYALSYNGDDITLSVTVPEPSTIAMILGLSALGFVAWRRRRQG